LQVDLFSITDIFWTMTKDAQDSRVRELMARLEAWTKEERGNQLRIANYLGVRQSAVSDWIAGRTSPSLSHGLAIIDFLKRQRRRR
jgi:predicted XRE-type DNA-binding protein